MGFYYEKVVRPILFQMDPEKAHDLGVTALDYLGRVRPLCRMMEAWNLVEGARPVELFGLQFPNAVGLAAGMDKDGRFWRAAPALGFGHVEIGTITLHQQPGNERPRVFRFPEHGAIINRMGFNNEGAEKVAARLKNSLGTKKRFRIPVGINIGKSKITPLDKAVEDYLGSFHHLVPYADYITINVSSPNTRELRRLQEHEALEPLMAELGKANAARAKKLGEKPTPLLLKIAPDLSFRQIDGILEVVERCQLSGIIATNTTVARPNGMAGIRESGGLSGQPLNARAKEVIRYISRSTEGRLPIVGVGGVDSPESAGALMDAGAHLVQLYTGMVYRGPFVAKTIAKAIAPRHSNWI